MIILKYTLYLLGLLHIVSIILALIKKDFWVFRIFDYPRMQKFVILMMVVITEIIFFRNEFTLFDWIFFALVCGSIIYLACLIFPFTIFAKPMIKQLQPGNNNVLSILIANVLQKNSDYEKVLKYRNSDFSTIFLVETDLLWKNNLQKIKENYPYFIEVPKDNTYGLLFYSKFKILDYKINYLIDPEIPSLIIDLDFHGETVRIFALHPTPPSPTENLYSTDRDAEILMIAKLAKESEFPCLVIGDLNDVAWSYTTELFLKTSGLLDPRKGRGWFNTYNANYPFFRWPLDHVFLSSHFRLVSLNVEEHIGSDHFPISIQLFLSHEDDKQALEADREDVDLAEEKIRAGKVSTNR